MKKILLGLCLLGSIYSAEAKEDHSRCTKINLGIVVIWSGDVIITDDVTGVQTTKPCSSSKGRWVWIWE